MNDQPGPQSRVYVAGHTGLAGSALVRRLERAGQRNLVVRRHAELELTDPAAVRSFFAAERPEYVFLAAAKVGGILANDSRPADFIRENLLIQTNVIDEARRHGVRRLLFLGSSCIYPREARQPIREDELLTGALEPTNRAYAVAKIAGIEMCWSYNRQHGTRFLAVMPSNLYGPGDNYDLQSAHVLAALLRKMHEAKARGDGAVGIWGSGTPRREFLHADDMADACVHLMSLPEERFAELTAGSRPPLVNIGTGVDCTIAELAQRIAAVVGYAGEFSFDRSKPDGVPRKLLDVSRLDALGWRAKIGLDEGLGRAYRDYRESLR
jgi:GDP-L-fucose synthase